MDLIKYEFFKKEDGAFNHLIGQLVKKVRYYREKVSIDTFKAAIPELKKLERQLQEIQEAIGETPRNYLQEIMDELSVEAELEGKVIAEIERSSKAIAAALYDTDFLMTDFAYEFRNMTAVQWIEFYGYKEKKDVDGTLLVVKEVFRSICYKFGIIFIDISLSDK
jgi:hypothetical protein